jgi:vacuole morphology and inheritance protein 14
VDVRLATENVLSEFLREIKCIAEVQEKQAELDRQRRESRAVLRKRSSRQTMQSTAEGNDGAIADDNDEHAGDGDDGGETTADDEVAGTEQEWEGEGSGMWQPGQGVFIDHAAIMDIIIQHLSYPGKLARITGMSTRS